MHSIFSRFQNQESVLIYIYLFYLESCTRCNDPFNHQLAKLYLEFLNTQLLPILNKKSVEYAQWWTFKPESQLARFLEKSQWNLNQYFTPSELISLIELIANQNNMFERGNYDIIFLNDDLKLCFDTSSIYLPDLYNLCLLHVNVVNDTKSFILKNELIKNEIIINSPLDLIYSDPSSKFWIPRQLINPYICEDNQIIFTWKEICAKFINFITSPHSSIIKMENMFFISNDSVIAKRFNFKYFHKNQIPDILKKMVKFLGKSNTILTLCPDLKFSHIGPNEPVVYWIEELILENNNLVPYVPFNIFL